jgi:hypothetical protein
MNENDVWYLKGGIKRAWTAAGATVLYGEYGQYEDQYRGMCSGGYTGCYASFQTGAYGYQNESYGEGSTTIGNITGSEVDRWGLGVVQEIDSAAMHLFARWQHTELDISGNFVDAYTHKKIAAPDYEDLDIFQVGGVIFF